MLLCESRNFLTRQIRWSNYVAMLLISIISGSYYISTLVIHYINVNLCTLYKILNFLTTFVFFQFCSAINNIRSCNKKETALIVRTVNVNFSKTRYSVSVRCYCSQEHYWEHFKTYRGSNKLNNTTTYKKEYKCALLKKCDTHEFCGNVRTDQNSIFYRCSCPEGHLCIYKDQDTDSVEELLYKGLAYRAICEPQVKNIDYDDY